MDRDEHAIRSLVATWMEATAAGDLARDGAWVIFRDANMVAPAPQPST
jgi:hypothetical protein